MSERQRPGSVVIRRFRVEEGSAKIGLSPQPHGEDFGDGMIGAVIFDLGYWAAFMTVASRRLFKLVLFRALFKRAVC